MKKMTARSLALGLTLAATILAGTAYAEQATRGANDRGGVTTRSEVQTRTAAMFARMDANKDGKLDQADRQARRNNMRNAMFDRLDANKDGEISRAEFSTPPQRPEGMRRGPEGAGSDRPGLGMRGGRHHGFGMRGGPGHGRMGMGRLADTDRDGSVTQAEFTAAALQRFDRLDANKDGQVTREERQAARKAMRDEWRTNRDAARPAT